MGQGKLYFVAELRAGDLRAAGLDVIPVPRENEPGHAEIPNLTYANRKDDKSEEFQVLLAHKLCPKVHGPYPGASSDA